MRRHTSIYVGTFAHTPSQFSASLPPYIMLIMHILLNINIHTNKHAMLTIRKFKIILENGTNRNHVIFTRYARKNSIVTSVTKFEFTSKLKG